MNAALGVWFAECLRAATTPQAIFLRMVYRWEALSHLSSCRAVPGRRLISRSIERSVRGTIYRFKIVGKRGTLVGTTQLGDASEVSQFFIDGRKVIGPDSRLADIGFWSYPAGGPPLKTIDGLTDPSGAVVTDP